MVKVREFFRPDSSEEFRLEDWLQHVGVQPSADQAALLRRACDQVRALEKTSTTALGESCFVQGLAMAETLAELNLDAEALTAAILYPAVHANVLPLKKIKEEYSSSLAQLLRGASRMDAIRELQHQQSGDKHEALQSDNLRKMLLAMVDDVRVVLIKLAEQLCLLREAKQHDEETRQRIAQETSDIYAPLANRLGIGQLKWELEDLAFRYLHPARYKQIAKALHERRIDRERYVNRVLKLLRDKVAELGIKNADVMGRAKHIYSIWRKMQRKNIGFDEVYDVRAVRILVPQVQDCYAILGVVHSLWQHIPKEFDDYIATPKENGYRSLHTAVIGPEGKVIEVQIRTFDMHNESELGVAAHWRYKEGRAAEAAGFEAKIAWLRQLLEWQEEVAEGDLLEEFRHEVVEDRVYVFTPTGKVVDLPVGATPVDFAYYVHTDIGHHCRGAKVNGRIVPLTYKLQTGEQVQILTNKTGGPSRDWLSPHSGYIASSRARNKIVSWFRRQDHDQNAAEGRVILEKELERLKLEKVNLHKLAQKFNYHRVEDLYAGIGSGYLRLQQVVHQAQDQLHLPKEEKESTPLIKPSPVTKIGKNDVRIEGVGDLLTKMAGCCKPIPGDDIVGYVSQGRGVIIHRQDCIHALRAKQRTPERLLEVSWGQTVVSRYPVDILVQAYDRQGLLRDITTLLANEKVSVMSLNTQLNRKKNSTDIHLQMEIQGLDSLSRVMTQLSQLPNVMQVLRKD